MKKNKEAEIKNNKKNSWVLAYANGSEVYIPNALHVEKNDTKTLVENDIQASAKAEKDGIPLIYDMVGVLDGTYVDTEENRQIIREMLILYPEYERWDNNKELKIIAKELIDGLDHNLRKTIDGLNFYMTMNFLSFKELREECWNNSVKVFDSIY